MINSIQWSRNLPLVPLIKLRPVVDSEKFAASSRDAEVKYRFLGRVERESRVGSKLDENCGTEPGEIGFCEKSCLRGKLAESLGDFERLA